MKLIRVIKRVITPISSKASIIKPLGIVYTRDHNYNRLIRNITIVSSIRIRVLALGALQRGGRGYTPLLNFKCQGYLLCSGPPPLPTFTIEIILNGWPYIQNRSIAPN